MVAWASAQSQTDRMQYSKSDPPAPHRQDKTDSDGPDNHAREHISKVNDPKAQALFEMTAEVVRGLRKAYEDFEEKK